MIRSLLLLSAFVVVAQSQTTTTKATTIKFVPRSACYYPWYVQGAFKTGKTTCTLKTIATDCADAVVDCVTNPDSKKSYCCKPSPTAVWPICPNKRTLQYRNNNPALKAGVTCLLNAKKTNSTTCATGYACTMAINDFTNFDLAAKNVCCRV